MGRIRMRANQIRGVNDTDLYEEITNIHAKILIYRKPVATPEDLPMDLNNDGDIRMVLSEDCLFAWDADTQKWYKKGDTHTERRLTEIPIPRDNVSEVVSSINVGGLGNIISLKTIDLELNGISQYNGVDFELSIKEDTNFLKVTWLSEDFPLEKSDKMVIEYDILLE